MIERIGKWLACAVCYGMLLALCSAAARMFGWTFERAAVLFLIWVLVEYVFDRVERQQ